MLNNYEKVGRWLCKTYYAPGGRKLLPECVVNVLESVICRNNAWLSLMSGTLRNVNARKNFLGERIDSEWSEWSEGVRSEWGSVDGKEDFLRAKELILYSEVGKGIINMLF